MAQAVHAYTTCKFHNLSNQALADAIGDTVLALRRFKAFFQD